MASAYIFTLHPTFTQGLVLGQLSILLLLFLVLKYLFFDTETEKPYRKAAYPPRVEPDSSDDEYVSARLDYDKLEKAKRDGDSESSEWLNLLLQQVRIPFRPSTHMQTYFAQVVDAYRNKLRNGMVGAEGDEVARQRVEDFANKLRPQGFLVRRNSINCGLLVALCLPRISSRCTPSTWAPPPRGYRAPEFVVTLQVLSRYAVLKALTLIGLTFSPAAD